MNDFQPGDYVRTIAEPAPDLIVELPVPIDQRPQFKGKAHLREGGWVPLADLMHVEDTAEREMRREVLKILTRKSKAQDPWTENPWTEDEIEAYREGGGWTPGALNTDALRVQKIIDAVRGQQQAALARVKDLATKHYGRGYGDFPRDVLRAMDEQ